MRAGPAGDNARFLYSISYLVSSTFLVVFAYLSGRLSGKSGRRLFDYSVFSIAGHQRQLVIRSAGVEG